MFNNSSARESTITIQWAKMAIFKLYKRKYLTNGKQLGFLVSYNYRLWGSVI